MKKPNKPGKKVGDYVLIEELGSGAFGEVLLQQQAQHRLTQEILAIKCIPRFKLKQHNGMVQTLLENEISVLQKIKNDNVVKFVQYMESPNQCYIVTEYCNGGDLLQYWNQRGECIPESEVILMLKQLLQGMKALHEQNIIHRDLKLSNILRHNGIIKISDFGFSKQLKTSQGQEILRLGTLGYMAPEIMLKQPYGLEVDMFSLGVVIYQLLMGRLPFDNSSDQNFLEDITNNKVDFEPPIGVKISKEFKILIEQMLQLDKKHRLKWSDLFLNPLILAKQKLSEPFSQASIQADKLNAEMSRIIYKEKESQQFQQNVSNQDEIQQVEEEEGYITEQQLLEIQLQAEEEQKVQDTYEKFFELINNIPFLKTYLLLTKIQCSRNPCIYFVASFILIKRMYFLQMEFIKKIDEQYDFFKVGKHILNQLDVFPQFWDFRESQQNYLTEIHSEFNQYLQQWHANQATQEFKEYDFRNWRKELCSNEPSEQFSQIFIEILQSFYETFQIQILQESLIMEHFQIFEFLQSCINYVILYLFKAFYGF